MDNYFFMNVNVENASSRFELTTLHESNSAQICAEICCLNHPGAFRLCLRAAALSQQKNLAGCDHDADAKNGLRHYCGDPRLCWPFLAEAVLQLFSLSRL